MTTWDARYDRAEYLFGTAPATFLETHISRIPEGSSVLAIADPFSAEQAVRMGGVVFRPIKQKLTYFVAVVAARREDLTREALKFVDLFSQQLQARVDKVESMRGTP